ncbi:hypothetical protein DB346_01115 [Verrucomicrobia bacterium LW23]|nr:hypothetical protein DB346_01115 [Verrucomicrobia bacterium LW23]
MYACFISTMRSSLLASAIFFVTLSSCHHAVYAQDAEAPKASPPSPQPQAAPLDYKHLGPVQVLDNGVVTLGVAARVGRVVTYQRKTAAGPSEPNWLGITDEAPIPSWHWNPWGGDRIWPTTQLLNPQIYGNTGWDPVIDGAAWEIVTSTPTALEIRSGLSAHLGIRITRRFELRKNSPQVWQTIVVEKLKPSVWPVHVWTVTTVRKDVPGQPDSARYFLLDNVPGIPHPNYLPYRLWPDVVGKPKVEYNKPLRTLHVAMPEKYIKAGTFGTWIAYVEENSAFIQTVAHDRAAVYLEASNLQAYAKRETQIYEIEALSPTWHMAEGERKVWNVTWNLIDFPAAENTIEARSKYLKDIALRMSAVPADSRTPSSIEGGAGSSD